MSTTEKKWVEDEIISKRMPEIFKEVKKYFPDFDTSKYEEKSTQMLIPNPFVLEKSNNNAEIFMAGLIHREYVVLLLVGVMNVRVTSDGRAVLDMEEGEVDITENLLNTIPNLVSACVLAIKDLSVVESYLNEINELMNIVALVLYLSVALKSSKSVEKVLTATLFLISKVQNEKIRESILNRVVKELRELGLEKLADEFKKIASKE